MRERRGPTKGRKTGPTLEDARRLLFPPRVIADRLPEAFADAAERRPQAMKVALEPALTEAMRAFARRETELFGELLSPTIGAAVRKAVADAIAALMQRFNEALERSLSVRSLRWRLEARRSGIPFAEVVLVHTLVYRVEQALLVHASTGLVLQHVIAAGAPSADPDQVASMLAALDVFAREAFQPRLGGVHLTHFEVGDLTVWVDWDPAIAVAVVIRGRPPRQLAELVRETRARVSLALRGEVAAFVSDVTPFERARPTLEACLHEGRRAPPRRAHLILLALGAACLLLLGWHLARATSQRHEQARTLMAYQSALGAQPGIVVSSIERRHGRYRVTGFRDPLAVDPAVVVAQRGYPRADLAFTPFQSLDPPIVEQRARRGLRPPEGARIALTDGVLRLWGQAPRDWIERARALGPLVAGVQAVDAAELRSTEQLAALRSLALAIESVDLGFARGSSRLPRSQHRAMAAAAELLRRLHELSSQVHLTSCVTVVGHSDNTGGVLRSRALAAERAASVIRALEARGIDPALLEPRNGGIAGGLASARNAQFEVELRPHGATCTSAQ
jgi:OOP family OmpA-OmpF porin